MGIVICPGLVAAAASQRFWQMVQQHLSAEANPSTMASNDVIFLPPDCPVYSPEHVLQALQPFLTPVQNPWVWIGFSAGVVGGLGAARHCHPQFPVQRFIALDAWGVPLIAPFPIDHLSHDRWTHQVVSTFNTLNSSFYADPGVNHLDLWETPSTVTGWDCKLDHSPIPTTAADYIAQLVKFRSIS